MFGPTGGHSARRFTHTVPHRDGRIDPRLSRVACEAPGCTNEIAPADSYSFVITMATTAGSGVDAFQCGDLQHFCCSPACARVMAAQCVEHLLTELAARTEAPQP